VSGLMGHGPPGCNEAMHGRTCLTWELQLTRGLPRLSFLEEDGKGRNEPGNSGDPGVKPSSLEEIKEGTL